MDPINDVMGGMRSLSLCDNQYFYLHSIGRSNDTFTVKTPQELQNNLYWTRLINTIAQQAIEHIQNRNYEPFDALVSECQCHLRAYYVARKILERVTFTFPKIEENEARFKKASFRELLEERHLVVQVPEWLLFFTEAHLLTIIKKVQTIESVCTEPGCGMTCLTTQEESRIPDHLQNGMPPKFMATRIKQVKESLNRRSVEYLQNEIAAINPAIHKIVTGNNVREIQSRLELPCAYSFTGTFQLLAHSSIPVLVKVQRSEHYLEEVQPTYDVEQLYVPVSGRFTACSLRSINPHHPVVILEGRRAGRIVESETTSDYHARLLNHPLERIVELNGAQHDQYTQGLHRIRDIQDISESEQSRLEKLAVEAVEAGCSFKNQSLLLLTHMFVGTIATHSITEGRGYEL